MEKQLQTTPIIDAVITWVDGSDLQHQKKMATCIGNTEFLDSNRFKLRFQNMGEVKYTVHSIIKYAPFIRHIYIVTDQQTPDFLRTKKEIYSNVFIVDHKDIFKKHQSSLPVFNSMSIETKLYEIPGLSEHFIYFNDDCFLLRKTKPTDFFINGQPLLRGRWQKFKEDIFIKKIASKAKRSKSSHIIAQEKAAKILGLNTFYRFHHTPHPLRKTTISSFFEKEKELEKRNSSFKFRSREQFIIQGLANHLEIINKTCTLKKNYQLIHIRSYKKPFFWIKFYLNFMGNRSEKLFLNLQNLEQCPKDQLQYILKWLDNKYALN